MSSLAEQVADETSSLNYPYCPALGENEDRMMCSKMSELAGRTTKLSHDDDNIDDVPPHTGALLYSPDIYTAALYEMPDCANPGSPKVSPCVSCVSFSWSLKVVERSTEVLLCFLSWLDCTVLENVLNGLALSTTVRVW